MVSINAALCWRTTLMAAWMQQLAFGVLCCGVLLLLLLLLLLHWAEDGADPGDGIASRHSIMRLSGLQRLCELARAC